MCPLEYNPHHLKKSSQTVLVVVTMCILAEIICRIIGSFPLMLGTMAGNEDWRTDNPELYETCERVYACVFVHHPLLEWLMYCLFSLIL